MARSNGNQDRTGGQPGQPARAAPPVDHGLPWHNGQGQQGDLQHGYDALPAGQHQPGQLPWPPQQTAPPLQQYQVQQTYVPPGYAPPSYPQPQNYAPQAEPHHGHYFPPAGSPQGSAADYAAQNYQNAAYAQGQAYPPGYQDPAQQLRGSFAAQSDQGYATGAYGHPQAAGHDPRGYDLGAYGSQQPAYADPATGRGLALPPPAGFGPAHGQAQPAAAAKAEEDFDDEEYEDEEEEPRRRFGIFKIIASLVVAVALGGGVAYGIKKYGGSLTASSKPVVVKADAAPAKTRPAGADGKAGERLGEQVPAVVAAVDTNTDTGGPAPARKVQTIAIPGNGAPAGDANPPLRPTISIPGVSVQGLPPAAPSAAPQPSGSAASLPPVTPAPAGRAVAPPPGAQAAAAQQRAPVTPRVIASAEEPAAAVKAAPQKVAVAQPPKASKASDAFSPVQGVGAATVAAATTTAAPAARSTGSNGFVAVLASQSSAIDARKTLDDMQSKYGEVLGGKPTDITEFANPADGKTYYRAVVGPPGSREAANAICGQVKTAGHKGCFAAAY